MKTRVGIAYWLGFVITAGLTTSCMKEESEADQLAHLVVRLTDAPGNYQEVNIDIQDVQVNPGDDDNGWKSLNVRRGTYDLLKLTNGLDTLLAETDLPPGKISQIRLILGERNTVRVDDKVTDLITPSAQQSGLKIQVHMNLEAGKNYEILLDFDAARSIVKRGKKEFNLKPVIRAIVELIDIAPGGPGSEDPGEEPPASNEPGAINGVVDPPSANPAIYAIMGSDTVSTMVNSSGMFLIDDLPVGTYRLVFVPIEGYLQEELTDVEVSGGQVTNVGTIMIGDL